MYSDKYFEKLESILREIKATQSRAIRECAEKMVETTLSKHMIYAVGCGHAGLLAKELFYRSGGLVTVNPIFAPGLELDVVPVTLTSDIERIEGYGKTVISRKNLTQGDFLLIHSVSGRNAVSIDMALEAKKRGVFVVCLTNVKYSESVSSRHSCGKRLFEVCSLVLDNCGDIGDAAVSFEGFAQKSGPTSTAAGAAILNAVVAEAVGIFLEKGVVPPVFMSANLDGGDEHNRKILDEYKNLITYM
jgi:uncharacterized phosphosugar-binding protein